MTPDDFSCHLFEVLVEETMFSSYRRLWIDSVSIPNTTVRPNDPLWKLLYSYAGESLYTFEDIGIGITYPLDGYFHSRKVYEYIWLQCIGMIIASTYIWLRSELLKLHVFNNLLFLYTWLSKTSWTDFKEAFYKYYENKLTCTITLKLIILVLDSVQTFLAC